MRGRSNVRLTSVHRQSIQIAADQVGRWMNHRFDSWTMVWSGVHGYQARLSATGVADRVVDRLPRSWALHGPGCSFHERLGASGPDRESMYLFFTVSGELPGLSGRALTVVADPDDRLAGHIRHMHRA
ncbi:MAG: hypothetical protein H0W83_18095, partial [Planctomycetes bacterium]|nr:hypothetical protein [Planctomycetota bacterium]